MDLDAQAMPTQPIPHALLDIPLWPIGSTQEAVPIPLAHLL